jgi:anhydro-N-acetylmuramic acid kinase
VCGGGAHNQFLMESLKSCLPNIPVETTSALGLPVLQVEAAAFAWLAWCFTQRRPANAVAATGASGPRILGALYPK